MDSNVNSGRRDVLKSVGMVALGAGIAQFGTPSTATAQERTENSKQTDRGDEPRPSRTRFRGGEGMAVNSHPIFLLVKRNDNRDIEDVEVVVGDAKLVMDVEAPQTRGGSDRSSVEIKSWDAELKSKKIAPETTIKFTSEPSRGASIVFNGRGGEDFPAEMTMSVFYRVAVESDGGATRDAGDSNRLPLFGTARATITQIPPAPTDIFNIDDKSHFSFRDDASGIEVIPIACAC